MGIKHTIPQCKNCFIHNESFRKLTNDEIDILSYTKNCNTYDKGDIIYNEGTRVTGIYCINSGIIKHYKTGNDGKEQIIRFSKTGIFSVLELYYQVILPALQQKQLKKALSVLFRQLIF
jgi:signal-transduction protein with cAMP-binding, CBS, and nucleotidyltransferase domain